MRRLLLTAIMITLLASTAAFAAGDHPSPWKRVSVLSDLYSGTDSNGNYVMDPGSYYLESDIETDRTLIIPSDKTVTICLHGNKLKGKAASSLNSVFHLEGNAVFTIQDCSEGGTIINN